MRPVSRALGLSLLVTALGAPPAAAGAPYFYVSPTLGAWHWDDKAYPDLEFDHSVTPMFGARAGYAFTQAFSGELVGLTGTNNAVPTGQTNPVEGLRLTEIDLSLLVHFQSLTSARLYPFLDLGLGTILRSGGPYSLNDSPTAFHLGGGLMYLLDQRFVLRANARDTFFTDKRQSGNLTTQPTVDALELSLGLELRFPVRGGGSHRPE
jgi:outer membrane protein with beta-barrel domain